MNSDINIIDRLSLCIQGTRDFLSFKFTQRSFIPVYTGNTQLTCPLFYKNHRLSLCIQGTHLYIWNSGLFTPFIPVYTGNTFSVLVASAFLPVYPCVYREHGYS